MAKTNKSAGGIGESKNFGAPEGERLQGGVDRILACHINKVLIADMNLDPAVLSALDWFATDEGEAEKRANPDARPASGIEMGADEFSKALEQRKDDVKQRDVPLFEARDPLKEVADRYAKPGMKAKFLSRTRIKDEGGTGMHEVVVKENGDPVMVKGMVLGHAPIAEVEARNAHFRAKGAQMLKQVEQKHEQENPGSGRVPPVDR